MQKQWHKQRGFALLDNVEPAPNGIHIVWPHLHDKSISIWDTSTNNKVSELKYQHRPMFPCFAEQGAVLLTSEERNRTVHIWRLSGNDVRKKLAGHRVSVTCATFSPDGSRLVSTGKDGKVRVWDTHTGKQLEKPLLLDLACGRHMNADGDDGNDRHRQNPENQGHPTPFWALLALGHGP